MFFWNYYFFCDPADVESLIYGSSACSKSSFNMWMCRDNLMDLPEGHFPGLLLLCLYNIFLKQEFMSDTMWFVPLDIPIIYEFHDYK